MPNIYSIKLPSFVYWVIGVFVLIIVLIFVGIFVSKKLQEKRKKDCFNILNQICQKKVKDNYKLELVNNNLAYDYFIETENYKYYIKLINNPNNQEICVNNAIKWQLRTGPHDKEIRFDMLFNTLDYEEDSSTGPNFKFEYASADEIGLEYGEEIPYKVGDNVKIKAQIAEYDEEHGLFKLYPLKLTKRK